MNIAVQVIFFLIVLTDAVINWYLIEKKNRKINHFIEALLYSLVCIGISSLLHFAFNVPIKPLIAFTILTRLAFFDPLLLLFRKKPLSYEGGIKPEKEKSLYDRIEEWFGIDIIWLRLIYGLAYITYIIVYYGAFT